MPGTFRLSSKVASRLRGDPDLHVVVTGGRGWIGRACLELLDGVFGDTCKDRISVFGSQAGEVRLSSGRVLPIAPMTALDEMGHRPALIAHFAFLTKDKVAGLPLSSFVDGNAAISDTIERAVRRLRPIGLLMPSSGAATQTTGVFEDNPYGSMKLADEGRFSALCQELDVKLSCPRLFNLSGPFINKLDGYVLACIIRDVQASRPIVLRADKRVIRSYVHVRDLLNVGISDLLFGCSDEPMVFETAGETAVEVGELAHIVSTVLGAPGATVERPALDPAKPDDCYVGDPTSWRRRLALHGIVAAPLAEQISDTADYLVSRAQNDFT